MGWIGSAMPYGTMQLQFTMGLITKYGMLVSAVQFGTKYGIHGGESGENCVFITFNINTLNTLTTTTIHFMWCRMSGMSMRWEI